MSKFNFSHEEGTLPEAFGLSTFETVGKTVAKWSDELKGVSRTVERIKNYEVFTEDEKLVGMFIIGTIYSAAMHEIWEDSGLEMPEGEIL